MWWDGETGNGETASHSREARAGKQSLPSERGGTSQAQSWADELGIGYSRSETVLSSKFCPSPCRSDIGKTRNKGERLHWSEVWGVSSGGSQPPLLKQIETGGRWRGWMVPVMLIAAHQCSLLWTAAIDLRLQNQSADDYFYFSLAPKLGRHSLSWFFPYSSAPQAALVFCYALNRFGSEL